MAELGSGNGTDYPGVLDKNDTTVADNVDDVKADHMNDVMVAVGAAHQQLSRSVGAQVLMFPLERWRAPQDRIQT